MRRENVPFRHLNPAPAAHTKVPDRTPSQRFSSTFRDHNLDSLLWGFFGGQVNLCRAEAASLQIFPRRRQSSGLGNNPAVHGLAAHTLIRLTLMEKILQQIEIAQTYRMYCPIVSNSMHRGICVMCDFARTQEPIGALCSSVS